MRRRTNTSRGFTLAELTMAVALLAFFSIFVVQMFAKADQLAKKARGLDQAVVCATNMAEQWKSDLTANVPAPILDLRQNRTAGKTATISLDSHFQICAADQAVYLAELTIRPGQAAKGNGIAAIDGLWQLSVVIGRAKPSDSSPVYSLNVSCYFPPEATAR